MRISTVSVRPTRRRSLDLMVGTALGCSLLVLAAPARADDECGAAAPGATVTCAAAGSPYATGVDYSGVQGGLTLQFAAGANVISAGQGVSVTGEGPLSILAEGNTIRVTPVGAQTGVVGVNAASRDDDITIHMGTVEASGPESVGIRAEIDANDDEVSGDIEITADAVTGSGLYATGISATNDTTGAISIDVGTVAMTGDRTTGIYTYGYGDVTVTADTVTTEGLGSLGVGAIGHGDVLVDVGTVKAEGEGAYGIAAHSDGGGELEVYFDAVSTEGDQAVGVYATTYAGGDITVSGGSVTALGEGSSDAWAAVWVSQMNDYSETPGLITVDIDTIVSGERDDEGLLIGDNLNGLGIEARGDVVADLVSITTYGANSRGAAISSTEGGIDFSVEEVETWGQFSVGVSLDTQVEGLLEADIGDVVTHGRYAYGVMAYAVDGDIELTIDSILTEGDNANGVIAGSENGDVFIDVAEITTRGDDALGISVAGVGYNEDATVEIIADRVVTEGEGAHGVVVRPQEASVTLTLGSVGVSGDNARGVWVVDGYGGALTLTADDVTTEGRGSAGVRIEEGGAATLTIGSVRTSGDDSAGIEILRDPELSAAEAVTVNVTSVTTGDAEADTGYRSAGINIANHGDITVNAGSVTTHAANASAIKINGRYQSDVSVTVTGLIQTQMEHSNGIDVRNAESVVLRLEDVSVDGFESVGISVTETDESDGIENGVISLVVDDVTSRGGQAIRLAGRGDITATVGDISTELDIARGLTAYSREGDVVVSVNEIQTNGINSGAVSLLADAGNLTLTAAEIRTLSSYSAGVTAGAGSGIVTLNLGSVSTARQHSAGVVVTSAEDVVLQAQSVTTAGEHSTAVNVTATGDVTMTLGRVVASGDDGFAVKATAATVGMTLSGELRGALVGAELEAAQALTVTLGAGASAAGSVFGLDLTSGTGTTVTNRGAISSVEGVALNVDGAAATIANIGSLTGRIDLTEAADRLDNSGTFRVDGDSDFGGAVDVLANTGTVTLAESTTPVQARLRNLERFDNAGTIDLSNGVAGDVLILDGVLNGQAGNEVLLDLDTRTATVVADRLVVGSLEGVTHIELDVQGAGVIGDTGVTLVTSTVAQTGQELDVTTAGGFLDYDAVFDTASREYRIVGAAAAQAWEPTKVASGAQMQWRRGADVISARFDDLRDSGAMGLRQGGGPQVWAQAFAGAGEVDGERVIDGQAVDLSHDVDVAGGQVGIDIVRGFGGGDLVVGLTGGVSETELEFHSNGDAATFTGFGLGAYAQWSNGPLAIGVLVKGDSYELEYDWVSADLSDEASGSTFGARVDAAWRIDAGPGWTIEPQASAWWTETDLSSISGDAGEVEFGDTRSLVGRAGVRVAHAMTLASGARIQPFVGVYGFNEFDGDNASRIHLGSQTLDVADRAADLWGEAVLGANVGMGPIQGFVQGEAAFGEISGFTARVGARLNW